MSITIGDLILTGNGDRGANITTDIAQSRIIYTDELHVDTIHCQKIEELEEKIDKLKLENDNLISLLNNIIGDPMYFIHRSEAAKEIQKWWKYHHYRKIAKKEFEKLINQQQKAL